MATVILGLFAVTAQAQPTALVYRSAFDGYRPYADSPIKVWREANDTVGRIGGWRAYAKEAHEVPPALATPAAPAVQPKVDAGRP